MTNEEKLREEWNEAFLPEVPTMLKSAEVKNSDGTYSCITCGIKRDAIADWWLSKIALAKEEGRIAADAIWLLSLVHLDEKTRQGVITTHDKLLASLSPSERTN